MLRWSTLRHKDIDKPYTIVQWSGNNISEGKGASEAVSSAYGRGSTAGDPAGCQHEAFGDVVQASKTRCAVLDILLDVL